MSELYIGLMSGTSMDGVDAVLADFSSERVRVLAHQSAPLPAPLKDELLALNTPSHNELHRAALAGNGLVRIYARLIQSLLTQSGISSTQVRAVGAHGQTVRHRPTEFDGTGYTWQLNQPALLAELCGIDVVADFRSRDVAAGGQGAPLVPPFHQAFFGSTTQRVVILNIGGISNLTLLPDTDRGALRGFDCGPGNALMDAWCLAHTAQAFDDKGQWAATGQIHAELLQRMQTESFFDQPPPKSTGRDLFNMPWLEKHLEGLKAAPSAVDVQTTLTELTAWACAHSLRSQAPHAEALIVCGGGALNAYLMTRLQAALPTCRVSASDSWGLPALQVEATAFAWLARQAILHKTGSVESVTGAKGARILGGIYPA